MDDCKGSGFVCEFKLFDRSILEPIESEPEMLALRRELELAEKAAKHFDPPALAD